MRRTNKALSLLVTLALLIGLLPCAALPARAEGEHVISGSGTQDDPYLIQNAEDWAAFAAATAGDSCSGKHYRLTADVSVSTMAADSESHPFCGSFDGAGHTITLTLSCDEPYTGGKEQEQGLALFHYAGDGCEIRNLCVDGSITTVNKFAAGFISYITAGSSSSWKNITIERCQSSVTIESRREGDATSAGFVGICKNYVALNISDSLFDGAFVSEAATQLCGFIGYAPAKALARTTNCLFNGDRSRLMTIGGSAKHYEFCRSYDANCFRYENCYYRIVLGNARQGINAVSMAPDALRENLGSAWRVAGEAVLPIFLPCEHEWTVETVAPTCTLQGYDVYTCAVCGESRYENYTVALGHDYSGEGGVCIRCGLAEGAITTWKGLQAALNVGGEITLNADITAGADDGFLLIPEHIPVTLDLNGHVLDRALSEAAADGCVIRVDGSLTLQDSEPTAAHSPEIVYEWTDTETLEYMESSVEGGVVTGGFNSGGEGAPHGGGVYVSTTGSLVIEGGSVCGNIAKNIRGGGVYLAGGSLTMSGGSVCGNRALGNTYYDGGGGVYVGAGGTLAMSGSAEISSNTAFRGGGVYAAGGALTMDGSAKISRNTAQRGGGVFFELLEGNSFLLDGEANISDNLADERGGGLLVSEGTDFLMTGGRITGNVITGSGDGYGGGGVLVDQGTTFTVTGGEISNNSAKAGKGGGVYVYSSGNLVLDGGRIADNQARDGGGVYASYNNKLVMKSGGISNNSAQNNGGGIYVGANASLAIEDGTVGDNSAKSCGGGIYLGEGVFNVDYLEDRQPGASLTMSGGAVSGNKVTNKKGAGGGVYVSRSAGYTLSGGTVSGNTARDRGGGVFLQEGFVDDGKEPVDERPGASFTMSGGEIRENTVTDTTGDGGGVYIGGAEDVPGASFRMSAGMISSNITQRNGGGLYVGGTLTVSGGVVGGVNEFMLIPLSIDAGDPPEESPTSNAAACGGGVYVDARGVFRMSAGALCGNLAAGNGGGVFSAGAFQMTGGAIIGNAAADPVSGGHGGGVYVDAGGSFDASGGMIGGREPFKVLENFSFIDLWDALTGEDATIVIPSDFMPLLRDVICEYVGEETGEAVLNMLQAGIDEVGDCLVLLGNMATDAGGGVYLAGDGEVRLSKDVNISSNLDMDKIFSPDLSTEAPTRSDYNSNLYLSAGQSVTVAGKLTGETPIGVGMETPGAFTSGWAEKMGTKDPARFFTNDSAAFAVRLNDGGEAELTSVHTVTVAEGITGGTVEPDKLSAAEGDTVALTVTPADGYEIDAVSCNDGSVHDIAPDSDGKYVFIMPNADVTVTAAFRLIPATVPTIVTQPGDLSLTYGDTTGNVLTVAASDVDGHSLSYQWYACEDANGSNPEAINGASGASYTVPTDRNAGTTEYYYCVVTATRTDNRQTATAASDVAAVSIAKADGPAAPAGLSGVAPTSAGGGDGRITGVTADMEYSTDGTAYTACTGTTITDLKAGTYYVRYRETATHEAGAAATVSVPAYAAPTWSVSGSFNGGALVATVTAPEGALLIAAVYDASGRQVSVRTYVIPAGDAPQTVDTGIAVTKDHTCKLLLVDGTTYAPLCPAWSGKG